MNDRKLKLNYLALEKCTEQYVIEECPVEETEVNESSCRWSNLSSLYLATASRWGRRRRCRLCPANVAARSAVSIVQFFDADNRAEITQWLRGFDYNGSLSEEVLKQPRGSLGKNAVTQTWVFNSRELSAIYLDGSCVGVRRGSFPGNGGKTRLAFQAQNWNRERVPKGYKPRVPGGFDAQLSYPGHSLWSCTLPSKSGYWWK